MERASSSEMQWAGAEAVATKKEVLCKRNLSEASERLRGKAFYRGPKMDNSE